jgi:hypothetical protein
LVAAGTPIQEITSLASLVKPIDRVKLILKFLYKRAGDRPSAGAGHVADVLRIIARHYLQLPVEQIERIKGWTKPVRLNYPGMTEKTPPTSAGFSTPNVALPWRVHPGSKLYRSLALGRCTTLWS